MEESIADAAGEERPWWEAAPELPPGERQRPYWQSAKGAKKKKTRRTHTRDGPSERNVQQGQSQGATGS
eukprot:10532305-Alexandrium_andersonii.AAC.1